MYKKEFLPFPYLEKIWLVDFPDVFVVQIHRPFYTEEVQLLN